MESTKSKLKEWYNKKFCLDEFMDKTVREIFRDYNDLNETEFWDIVYGEGDDGYDYCCTESMYKYYMYLQNGGEPIEPVTESNSTFRFCR